MARPRLNDSMQYVRNHMGPGATQDEFAKALHHARDHAPAHYSNIGMWTDQHTQSGKAGDKIGALTELYELVSSMSPTAENRDHILEQIVSDFNAGNPTEGQ